MCLCSPKAFMVGTLLPGTAAMRNTKRGSWYVEALTSVFAEDSRHTHVADMLVKVKHGGIYSPTPTWVLKGLPLLQNARINLVLLKHFSCLVGSKITVLSSFLFTYLYTVPQQFNPCKNAGSLTAPVSFMWVAW